MSLLRVFRAAVRRILLSDQGEAEKARNVQDVARVCLNGDGAVNSIESAAMTGDVFSRRLTGGNAGMTTERFARVISD